MSFTSNYAGGLGSLFLCASLGSPPFHLASPCCVWFPSCRLSSVCSLCLRLSTLGPEPSRLCVSMSFRCSCPVCSSCASPSLCLLAVPFVLQVYSEFFSFRLFPTWFSVCFLCLAYPLRTESPSISSVRSPPSKDGKWAGYTYIHAHDVQTYTHKVQTDRQTNRQTHIHTYIHTYTGCASHGLRYLAAWAAAPLPRGTPLAAGAGGRNSAPGRRSLLHADSCGLSSQAPCWKLAKPQPWT